MTEVRRVRIGVYLEVDVVDEEQQHTVVTRFINAVMPAVSSAFRRTDMPTLNIEDVPK